MEQATRFVGMDVHKDTIVVAVTATGEVGKAMAYGTFPNTTAALEKLVKRLRQAGSGPIKFCYEAGPCGYGVHRALTKMGEDCMVVAPSMIPRKSGDRQKTDKRDADGLAVLHRGGLLTAVWVPDAAHEAMRDLIRARLAAIRAVRAARQQLSAFLLRHERIYPEGRTAWTKAHRGWLVDQSFAHPTANRAGGVYRSRAFGRTAAGSCRRLPARSDPDLVIVPSGAEPVCAPWPGHDRQRGFGGRHRGSVALRVSARLHGLSRSGAVRTFLRPKAAHRRHYQSRRRSRAHPADRGRTQLPLPGPHHASQVDSRRGRARGGAHDCLEGADAVVPALSADDGEGQAEAGCGHRNRTRVGRVRLVHCLHHIRPCRDWRCSKWTMQ